ncbi:hypothetical protein ACL6C3_28945 [Capilliphycus salinus ALCB114379]|uniref:hypothetical protein n=1 Tax=Capilliphycus salinus TaxID=2768948 RepID=UPI0039A65ABC
MSSIPSSYSYRVAREHAEFSPKGLGSVELISPVDYPPEISENYTFWMYIDRQNSTSASKKLATVYYPLNSGLPVLVICSNNKIIEINWESGDKGLTQEILLQLYHVRLINNPKRRGGFDRDVYDHSEIDINPPHNRH